ncbi:myophilin-like isoform X2 [Biomphalaria glabrata]|uniref:Transgelin n=1 Tax=Biomphalaria glabrata TaxID=6526 RepID=A0A9U8E3K5_BIOGL|nr:myophilin-like isoform X2 [Biomphalaria glabrata]
MAGLRAPRAGSARENQIKVENSFDSEEALKCLAWIREITGEPINLESVLDNKHKVSEFFYRTLKDGILLCKLVNAIVPDDIQINMKSQTFKKSNNDAFESAKERARIELFVYKCQEFGVAENNTFQTDSLYERTNLSQVCAAIRALGIEAESRPSYTGKRMWPKKSEINRRTFTEEQLRMGESVINLQMGTNKFANQSGMNFGKKRMITKD